MVPWCIAPRIIGMLLLCLLLQLPLATTSTRLTSNQREALEQVLLDRPLRFSVSSDGRGGGNQDATRRVQQDSSSPPPACDEVLETWNVSQVMDGLQTYIDSSGSTALQSVLFPLIKYGVQIRKICASCSDPASILATSTDFCSSDAYGSDVTFSGLAMIPLQEEDLTVIPGRLILNMYARGTRASSEPSTEWQGSDSTPELLYTLVVTVVTGCVSLLPDYMGYGESLGTAYRSYIVNKSYQTSSVPLAVRLHQLLQVESQNTTRLSNGAVVNGYSEGGYAAVSIANALNSVGIDILYVQAGGAPIAIASTQLLRTLKRIDQGTFPPENFFFLALLGSAFSSTNPDLANYQKGQDLLDRSYRNRTVQLVNTGSTSAVVNNFIYDLNGDDPTVLFSSELTNFTRTALAAGDTKPCGPDSSLPGKPEFLCAALEDQDLTQTVLDTTFPIQFCHSPDDVLVDYGNVPNVSLNDKLSLSVVSGSHFEAGGACLTQALLWFLNPDLDNYLAQNDQDFLAGSKQDPGAAPNGGSPTSSTTKAPAPSPTKGAGDPTSSAVLAPALAWLPSVCGVLSGLAAFIL